MQFLPFFDRPLAAPLNALAQLGPTTSATQPIAASLDGTLAERAQSVLGLVAFILLAFLIGRLAGARGRVPWRLLLWGVGLQFAFALIVLNGPGLLKTITGGVQALLDFTKAGAFMIFGNLIDNVVPVTADEGGSGNVIGYARSGAVFAFFVLPTIIFFSSLTAVLYHVGVLGAIVRGLAWVMQKTMGTSGAETLAAAANIFVGQTEAPLIVRPFLALATRSELMAVMVGGFANIASGVLGLYAIWLEPFVTDAAGHLVAACFISAPASLLVAKLLLPETEESVTAGAVRVRIERFDANTVDAAARGATEGLTLALNVAACLIAFTALLAMVDALIGVAGGWTGVEGLSLGRILGWVLAPLAWLTGVPWRDAPELGSLLGIKTVLNELIAYQRMSDALTKDATFLSPRSAVIATYALCGFANFASVGIQIGGIATLAPSRRADLSRIGLLAMVGGAIASLMTACVVGVLL